MSVGWYQVCGRDIRFVLDRVTPLLEAWERKCTSGITVEDILWEILERRADMWLFAKDGDIRSVVVTRIATRGLLQVLELWVVSTKDYRESLDLAMELFTDYARAFDCDVVEVSGRRGWQRILDRYGFIPQEGGRLQKVVVNERIH